MAEFTAITPEVHAEKAWKNVVGYAFSSADHVIPLAAEELSRAVATMPVGFIEQDSGYQLVAITSLQSARNLYVSPEGKWQGLYVPSKLRAYPFGLLKPESSEKLVLCINEASGLVVESTDEGNAFYDDQNKPTQEIKDVINFLSKLRSSLKATELAVKTLDAAGLITAWDLSIKQGEEVVPVRGLFRVDEEALNKLNDEDFLTLRKAGSLAIAYAQLCSMSQLLVLERLGELQVQNLAKQAAKSEVTNLNEFSLFEDEGSLNFD